MARKPSFEYTLHKPTGQAFVRIDGRFVYLGKYGTHDSRVRHRSVVAAAQAKRVAADQLRPLSVGELCERFVLAMQQEHGKRSWQDITARSVALSVCAMYAGLEAAAFGPKALQDIQQATLKEGKLTRHGVNRRKQHIVAMFKWAHARYLLIASDGSPVAWHMSDSPLWAQPVARRPYTISEPLRWRDLLASRQQVSNVPEEFEAWLKGGRA